jgi:hypothetical protein
VWNIPPLGYENILIATGMEVMTLTFFLTIPPDQGLTSTLELLKHSEFRPE